MIVFGRHTRIEKDRQTYISAHNAPFFRGPFLPRSVRYDLTTRGALFLELVQKKQKDVISYPGTKFRNVGFSREVVDEERSGMTN
jgi:hypothetical protein